MNTTMFSASSTTKKGLVALVLVFLCFIPTLFIMAIIGDRESRNMEVRADVARQWGDPQEFLGPVLIIPFTKIETIDGKAVEVKRDLFVFPKTEGLKVSLAPSERVRGIFRIPVYTADITGEAQFEVPSLATLAEYGRSHDLAKATIGFPLTDVRSIDPGSTVTVGGVSLSLLQGGGVLWTPSGTKDMDYRGYSAPYPVYDSALSSMQGVHVSTNVLGKRTVAVTFAMKVNGNERFSFVPAGSKTNAEANSTWSSPSFDGAYLPATSDVREDGFSATWAVSGLGRSFPDIASSDQFSSADLSRSLIGISLYDGVDQYAMVNRAVKYAILFIALTFMGFFFVEVLNRLRVHPVQYVLVGAALALFYLLLLSLSEQIAFGLSYLIAAVMTVLLISVYSSFVLRTGKHAVVVGVLLTALYGYLYMVLRSEDYALLSGTILLFLILAFTMYITRKVDWYGLDAPSSRA